MKITVLTIFPELIEQALAFSIPARAQQKGALTVVASDLRDYGYDTRRNVDDTPYGGGPGMVLRVDVAYAALEAVDPDHKAWRVMLSPDGETLTQNLAKSFTQKKELVLICGRYEGFDQRIENYVDQKLSIGSYVLSGGELPALVVVDAIARLLPGVLGNEESTLNETFENDQTDFPNFTRPEEFMGQRVPEVLLSGHHAEIEKWRKQQQRQI